MRWRLCLLVLRTSTADTSFPAAVISHLDYCNQLLSAVSTSCLCLPPACPGHPVMLHRPWVSSVPNCGQNPTQTQPGIRSPSRDAPNPIYRAPITPLHVFHALAPRNRPHSNLLSFPCLYSSSLLPSWPSLSGHLLCCQNPCHPSRLSSEAPSTMKLGQPCLPISPHQSSCLDHYFTYALTEPINVYGALLCALC